MAADPAAIMEVIADFESYPDWTGSLKSAKVTVPGENGHRVYQRAGWTQSGIIPDYALFPDGRLCDTAVMWKRLAR